MDYKYKYHKYKHKYNRLKNNKYKIIGISGISGAGKTTIGKKIADLTGGIFIDQDWFFKRDKPLTKLSDGTMVKNWDSTEAIDIPAMISKIRQELTKNKPIILAGFALRDEYFDPDTKPSIQFHIKIPKELSLQTRYKVKNFSPKYKKLQDKIFTELVYPFYLETLNKSKIDYIISGTKNNSMERVPMEDIINQIMDKLN